tara:strand:+ start:44 stop:430 length:387 start_codon:yes stop_codon:yes gene_type:complete
MLISPSNSQVRSVSVHNHMKVKLLRPTMIAGVPTDSGSIVDVEKHTGEYLVAIDKAELVVEVCEAPVASTETVVELEPTNSDEVDFSEMTKSQIETYGRKLGIELDRRQNKTDLIAQLEEFISTQEES